MSFRQWLWVFLGLFLAGLVVSVLRGVLLGAAMLTVYAVSIGWWIQSGSMGGLLLGGFDVASGIGVAGEIGVSCVVGLVRGCVVGFG